MAQGSNDLNMLLKAKVVKLKVELDYKGSKLPSQVNSISKFLENKPVKLKVKLEATFKDLTKQISTLSRELQGSKTFKPMKIAVEIDVKGSATHIKSQLKEIQKVVEDFNRTYGQQLKKMQEMNAKAQAEASKGVKGVNIPTTAGVQNFNNIKNYVKQLEEAEQHLRSKLKKGEQALFSSFEVKDAKGNLEGFIATLQKANGVVEKVRYSWNKDKNLFQVVDRTTATNIESMVQKSTQALANLEREIDKTGKQASKFRREYAQMMKDGANNNLNMDAVKAFQTKIKNAQAEIQSQKQLNELKREEIRLMRDIKNTTKGTEGKFTQETKYLLDRTRQSQTAEDYKNVRLALTDLKSKVADYNKIQKEAESVDRQRGKALQELTKLLRTTHETEGALSRDNIKATQQLAQRAQTTRQMAQVQAQLNNMYKQQAGLKDKDARTDALRKLKDTMLEFARVTGVSSNTIEARFKQMQRNVGSNLAQIQGEIKKYTDMIKKETDKATMQNLDRQANSIVKELNGFSHKSFRGLINDGDITKIKDYLSATQKLNIATAKISTNAKGISTITATLESSGKTAKQVTYQIDTLTNKLRYMGQQDVFNRNANLGVFEQLKIAMARVPVWMASMTAFYGTINSVRAMTDEILKLDKALTELRRVASDSISIDTLFSGAMNLSQELGNNIHDVMASLNDFARTFGDFNERQLLAITRTATLMSNVSDLSAQEATENLVGTMNAFNITAEDSIHIVDALNEVDNNYAISTKQLAEGLSKSASTAKTFGVSMEETVGHITAIGAVTMESGAIIGNSLKTIYSRITTMKDAKEALNGVKVAVTEVKDGIEQTRDVSDILNDLSVKWDTLSKAEKQNLAVKIAGRYQLSRFLALMNNYQMAIEATDTAVNSQGSAMRENAEYLKSFEARINSLKNGFTELSSAMGEAFLSAGMTGVISFLTKLAQLAITVTKNFGALPVVLLAVAGILGKMNMLGGVHNGMMMMLTGAGNLIGGIGKKAKDASKDLDGAKTNVVAFGTGATTAMNATTSATNKAAVATKGLGISIKSLLASTLVGALFVGLGMGIEWLANKYQDAKAKQEALVNLNKKMVESYRQHADGMKGLVARYAELDGKATRSTEEQREYLKLQKQLAEQVPTTVRYIDANGKAHMKNVTEIKKEIEAVAKLSQEQATLMNMKFAENMEKQAEAYQKVTEKIEKLYEKQQQLKNQKYEVRDDLGSAQDFFLPNPVSNVTDFSDKEREKAVQQNKVDVLMAEAEKTEAIKKTLKSVQEQTLAYFESKRQLSSLGDAQQGVIEKFIQTNESMLRGAKTTGEYKKAYQDLFNIGKQTGEVFVEAYSRMSKGLEDDPIGLEKVKNQLQEVALSLPATFFQMTDDMGNVTKSTDDVVNGLKEVINVSNAAQNGASWDELIGRLEKTGMTSEEAGGYLARLAREHDIAGLRAEAQARGVEEINGALDGMIEKTLEALDLTSELFGYSGSDLTAMKSRLQLMDLLVSAHGDGAKSTQQYRDSVEDLTDFLNISESELEANKDKYFEIIDALGKVDMSTYDTKSNFEDFIRTNENLTDSQKDLLIEWSKSPEAVDVLTGAHEEVAQAQDETAKSAEDMKKATEDIFDVKGENKLKEEVKDTKKEVEDNSWMDDFKKDIDDFQSRMDDFWKGFNDGLNGLGNWFERFIPPSMKKDLEDAADAISKFWDKINGSGEKKKKKEKPEINTAPLTGWEDDFMGMLSDLPSMIDDALGNVPSQIIAQLGEASIAIGDWFNDTMATIGDWASDFGTAVSDFFAGIPEFFEGLPDQVRPALEEAYVSVKEFFVNLPSTMAEGWEGFSTGFTDFFSGIGEAIGNFFTVTIPEAWNGGVTAVQTFFTESIPNMFTGLVDGVNQGLQGMGDAITNFFTVTLPSSLGFAFGYIGVMLVAGWNGAVNFVTQTLPTMFQGWVDAIQNFFTNTLPQAFSTLGTTIQTGIQNAVQGAQGAWDGLVQGAQNAWNNVVQGAQNAWNGLVTGAQNAVNGVANWFAELPSRVAGAFQNLWSTISSTMAQIGTDMANAAMNAVNGVAQWMADLPARVQGALNDALNAVIEWGAGLIDAAVQAAQDMVSGAGDEADDMGGELAGAVADAPAAVGSALAGLASEAVAAVNQMIADAVAAAGNLGGALMGAIQTGLANFRKGLMAGIEKAKKDLGAGGSSYEIEGVHSVTDNTGGSNETSSVGGTFGATSGEGGSISSGGGGGTSGTLHKSIYEGGLNSVGDYKIRAFADSDMPDANTPNSLDLGISKLDISINILKKHMESLTKNTQQYRDAMREVYDLETKRAFMVRDQLIMAQARNKQIEKQLDTLKNISSHTKEQREQYNSLWQEYQQNLSTIQQLGVEWQDFADNNLNRWAEILLDEVTEIINKVEEKVSKMDIGLNDLDFESKVIDIVEPDNLEKQTSIIQKQIEAYAAQEREYEQLFSSLRGKLAEAQTLYGVDSDTYKEILSQLDGIGNKGEEVTLQLLQAEKQIKDMRSGVADDSISQLKDYYGKMKDMALNAIEAEKDALEKASKEKQELYDEEIDKINEVYDAKSKQMDKEEDEADYQEELADKNAERAKLVSKIALLSRNSTPESKKELAELQDELAEMDKDIADFQKDRQKELEKQALDEQQQAQIDAVKAQKEAEQKALEDQQAILDQQKDDETKKYDDILNNDEYWAKLKEQFTSGDFSGINAEMLAMQETLSSLDAGNLEALGAGFANFSDTAKQAMLDFNDSIVNNMMFGLQDVVKALDYINNTDYKDLDLETLLADYVDVWNGDLANQNSSKSVPTKPKQDPPKQEKKPTPKPTPKDPNEGKAGFKKSPTTGKWINDDDSFESNDLLDPNRNKAGYVQAEDGSWVKTSFYKNKSVGQIFNTDKLVEKVKNFLPAVQQNNLGASLAGAVASVNNTNNTTYELHVNIDNLNGNKDGANTVVKEIMKGLKKMGK